MEFKHTRRRWTVTEDTELWLSYGNTPVSEIARELNRSEQAVRKRASALGYKSRRRRCASPLREWSACEERELIENFHAMSTQELSKKLNRSETAIIRRARALGVENRYAVGA